MATATNPPPTQDTVTTSSLSTSNTNTNTPIISSQVSLQTAFPSPSSPGTPPPSSSSSAAKDSDPTIRFIPYITETYRGLNFPIIEKKLPNGKVLKVKRYVEKGNSDFSDAIAFKSKVVSRQHGEIWTVGHNFYFKDTKSSSGTFINNLRVSPANTESAPILLKDGDIVQLGVDYQGRSEDIFKCVRMKVELNREAFQHRSNAFRNQVVKALRALAAANDKDSQGTGDCCICLGGIAPFQALFIAPCCHSFHFKCARPLLHTWPTFSCPLCRHFADLSASVSIDDLAHYIEEQKLESDSPRPLLPEEEVEMHSPNGSHELSCAPETTDHAPPPPPPPTPPPPPSSVQALMTPTDDLQESNTEPLETATTPSNVEFAK